MKDHVGVIHSPNDPQTTEISGLIKAIYDRLECLVDPHSLFKEVRTSRLAIIREELKKEVKLIRSKVEYVKSPRPKKHLWVRGSWKATRWRLKKRWREP